MIVQSARKGGAHFVVLQIDHARASGQLARAFGNDVFAPLQPRALMEHLTSHHDEGWAAVDGALLPDPNTGLPYNLTATPLPELVKTGSRSPDVNEQRHPLCGVISSMHTYGLYHGRYGLSDKVFIDALTPEHKPAVEAMLAEELKRQARLKEQLREDAKTADWAEEAFLFHNYKLLQFFDTLALYVHMVHEEARGASSFKNVPVRFGEDVTITVEPVERGRYRLSPYPFAGDRLEVTTRGRYLRPQARDADLGAVFEKTPLSYQTLILVSGKG